MTSFEVVTLEPPVAGQLETTVEQSGIWRHQDAYLVTRQESYARVLAELLGAGSHAGRVVRSEQELAQVAREAADGAPIYWFPHMTLIGPRVIESLGLRCDNFYGGAVSHPHEATKLLFRPLWNDSEARPAGWNEDFSAAVAKHAIPGHAVFRRKDLVEATTAILDQFGRARLKLPTGSDGDGQFVIRTPGDLDRALPDRAEQLPGGAVVEVDLKETRTCAVTFLQLGNLRATAIGEHHRDTSNPEVQHQTGADYLTSLGPPEAMKLEAAPIGESLGRSVMELGTTLDQALRLHLPQLLVTRRNYQIIDGVDQRGRHHRGMLEQSWRRGAGTAAIFLALKALRGSSAGAQLRTRHHIGYRAPIREDQWVLCQSPTIVAEVVT